MKPGGQAPYRKPVKQYPDTVTGHIVARLREDYYIFRDATGQIRVEIEAPVWRKRQIGPETKVRLFAEVDRGIRGRYLSVESLEVVD